MESSAGRQLLAHELTHTIQQRAVGSLGAPGPRQHSPTVDGGLVQRDGNEPSATSEVLIDARSPNSSSGVQSRAPVAPVAWTGTAVSMANAMRNLLIAGDLDRIADSLIGLWVRDIVDTLRMLKLEPTAFAAITGAPRFKGNPHLMAALEVVEGRSPSAAALPPDQYIQLRAIHDAADWPRIIGPQSWRIPQVPNSDTDDPVLSDARYLPALYDTIRRSRALAGQYVLRSVNPRPADRVPGGFVYVGPSQKGDKPSGLDVPDAKRKEVNEAVWKELGVGEGTQASINTWDSAKFTFGPGFAASGLLRQVMDNLAKSAPDVLAALKTAGVIYQNGTWFVVDTDAQTVKAGAAALDVLSKDIGLIRTFLDTANDPVMRRQWMEAEWQALRGASGAAAVPDQVVKNWPVELIVFVAHCVHWGGGTWKGWDSATPPSLFDVVRKQAKRVPARKDDPRILTLTSAGTFLGFSGHLLQRTMRERGRRQGIDANLPDGWATGFADAVALPTSATTPVFQIIEADEN